MEEVYPVSRGYRQNAQPNANDLYLLFVIIVVALWGLRTAFPASRARPPSVSSPLVHQRPPRLRDVAEWSAFKKPSAAGFQRWRSIAAAFRNLCNT
jgi:hypothetical protein